MVSRGGNLLREGARKRVAISVLIIAYGARASLA